MRLHSDTLTLDAIRAALDAEKDAGRIARHVTFKTLTEHHSRDYRHGFEVQLEAYTKVDGDGRRFGNSGSYGRGENYTATYDEWGYLLNALYELDREMRVGSRSHPDYEDRGDFHHKTGLSYSRTRLALAMARNDDADPYPFTENRTAGQAGRKGAGRTDGDRLPRDRYTAAIANPGKLIAGYLRYVPRSI